MDPAVGMPSRRTRESDPHRIAWRTQEGNPHRIATGSNAGVQPAPDRPGPRAHAPPRLHAPRAITPAPLTHPRMSPLHPRPLRMLPTHTRPPRMNTHAPHAPAHPRPPRHLRRCATEARLGPVFEDLEFGFRCRFQFQFWSELKFPFKFKVEFELKCAGPNFLPNVVRNYQKCPTPTPKLGPK